MTTAESLVRFRRQIETELQRMEIDVAIAQVTIRLELLLANAHTNQPGKLTPPRPYGLILLIWHHR